MRRADLWQTGEGSRGRDERRGGGGLELQGLVQRKEVQIGASVPSASRAPGSMRRGHVRSGVTPQSFCGGGGGGGATRRRGGDAVGAHGKENK